MEDGKDVRIVVDGSSELRKGVYSNISMAKTTGKETIIDFAMLDHEDAEGTMRGVLQTRVIMCNEAFVEFASMIAEHFDKNFKKAEDDD